MDVPAAAEGPMLQQTERQDLLADVGERYRLLLDTINEGIFFHERGVIYEVNQAMADMTGYSLEELFSLRIFDIVAPDSRRELVGHMRAEDPGPYEINLRRKDESIFPVEVAARSAEVSGRTVRVVIVRDITRQKEHEESIREHSRQVLALSTPIVRVWPGVLLLPLVGVLDDERANRMTSNLLEGVVESEAQVAIIDVSGTVGMDSSAARHLALRCRRRAPSGDRRHSDGSQSRCRSIAGATRRRFPGSHDTRIASGRHDRGTQPRGFFPLADSLREGSRCW